MKIAYKIQANGQATDLRFVTDDFVGADEIVIEGDILPDINTLHDLAYLKNLKIAEIKQKAEKDIKAIYPAYRQTNINELQGYTQDDKDAMWAFINSIRDKSNQLEDQVNACTTIGELEVIQW